MVDIGVCQITAQPLRQRIVTLAPDLSHHCLAPFLCHQSQVALHVLVASDSLFAHRQIVLCSLAAPFTCDPQRGIWVITGHIGSSQRPQDASRTVLVPQLIRPLLCKSIPHLTHHRGKVKAEIVVHQTLYLRKSLSVLYCHILLIFFYSLISVVVY